MAGRALAFSDPDVIRLLSEDFVAVAENSSSLERQQDEKGVFFRQIAAQGHYGGRTYPTTTRQGSCTFTADGRFLASVNTRDPAGMAGMVRTALTRWAEPEPDPTAGGGQLAALPEVDPVDKDYPADGLVLEAVARDLPREVDTRPDDWRKIAWNFDYVWLTRDEARALVPEARQPGSRREAPWLVVRRLARFHLRDFVRGEPFNWPEEAIRAGNLTAEIVATTGDTIALVLRGQVRLEHEARWVRPEDGEERRYSSGYDCALYGEATWDDARQRFASFDLVASGPRWGANQYNNREDDLGPAPLGIAFGLAGDTPREHTPPHCLRTWRHATDIARPSRVVVNQPDYFGAGE
ncbi:MAG: hypothetical protein ACTHMP_05595 [Thermomicrobiales bacterium]